MFCSSVPVNLLLFFAERSVPSGTLFSEPRIINVNFALFEDAGANSSSHPRLLEVLFIRSSVRKAVFRTPTAGRY